jgi:hypothetical protein
VVLQIRGWNTLPRIIDRRISIKDWVGQESVDEITDHYRNGREATQSIIEGWGFLRGTWLRKRWARHYKKTNNG